MIDNIESLSYLIDQGLSLIPVKKSSKSPYAEHKGKPKLNLVQLLDAIKYYDQNSEECKCVAIRCGTLSGIRNVDGSGLICIDVDSKYNEGFSERIYSDIKELYPEIFEKLVIDKTPSGGLHFYYRININEYDENKGSNSEFPRSKNLALRYSDEKELLLDPGRKTRCFLELKAEGGLSQCYPSFGYTNIRLPKGGFQQLSIQEHGYIISLCCLYDKVEKEQPIKIKNSNSELYIQGKNPFECFNNSSEASNILLDLGWTVIAQVGKYIRYKKPNKKDKEVGGTFNIDTRIYNIFTSNSDLEQKCYNPSSLLCSQKFNNDWSKFYYYLKEKGYGEYRKNVEINEIKKSIKLGISPPKNISEEGIKRYEEQKAKSGEKYPYGEFWYEEKEDEFKISREKVYLVSKELGFRSHKGMNGIIIVYIDDYKIKEVDERFYFDRLKWYLLGFNNIEFGNKKNQIVIV